MSLNLNTILLIFILVFLIAIGEMVEEGLELLRAAR